jgi:hypothetical protein
MVRRRRGVVGAAEDDGVGGGGGDGGEVAFGDAFGDFAVAPALFGEGDEEGAGLLDDLDVGFVAGDGA